MSSVYARLKEGSEGRRAMLEERSPEPRSLDGSVFMNPLVTSLSREDLYNHGMKLWTMIAMASIITAADELTWETYFDLMDKYQRPAIKRTIDGIAEDFDVSGSTLLDCHTLVCAWAKGCGFGNGTYDAGPDHLWAAGLTCPQIDALHALEMTDQTNALPRWCDSYDNLLAQARNPDSHYSHVECLGLGDNRCRYCIRLDSHREPGESFGQRVMRLGAEAKESDAASGKPLPFLDGIGYTSRVVRDSWTPEMRWLDGVTTKGRIAHESLLMGAKALGWERLLELIEARQGRGTARHAVRVRAQLAARGNTLIDAANLWLFTYTSMGFHWHTMVEYSERGVEVVAKRCPIVDSAQHIGLMDAAEDMSLWCDWYHNHALHAVREDTSLVHTHCLARGDKYCRACVERTS